MKIALILLGAVLLACSVSSRQPDPAPKPVLPPKISTEDRARAQRSASEKKKAIDEENERRVALLKGYRPKFTTYKEFVAEWKAPAEPYSETTPFDAWKQMQNAADDRQLRVRKFSLNANARRLVVEIGSGILRTEIYSRDGKKQQTLPGDPSLCRLHFYEDLLEKIEWL